MSQNFGIFCHFRGHFRHSQENPKIATNIYRTKLNLCEIKSVGDTRQFEYKFGCSFYKHQIIKIWQNLEKNASQIMIFLPHLCGRNITIRPGPVIPGNFGRILCSRFVRQNLETFLFGHEI